MSRRNIKYFWKLCHALLQCCYNEELKSLSVQTNLFLIQDRGKGKGRIGRFGNQSILMLWLLADSLSSMARNEQNQIKSNRENRKKLTLTGLESTSANIYLARHHSVARSHAALIANIRCFDACSFDELDFERVHRKFFALLLLNLSIILKRLESAHGRGTTYAVQEFSQPLPALQPAVCEELIDISENASSLSVSE
jgi:hypothetical protein